MDGWAVRDADARAPGASFKIVGESAAGRPFDGKVGPGEAVRIFTGAAMPKGADSVVIQEEAQRDGDEVILKVGPAPHANTRAPGGDFQVSDQLLVPGVRLDPWRIALAAAAGRAHLRVRGRPKVAILSTGEEIVSVGVEPSPFQIYDSGSPALASLVRSWGGEPVRLAPAADDKKAIADAVRAAGLRCGGDHRRRLGGRLRPGQAGPGGPGPGPSVREHPHAAGQADLVWGAGRRAAGAGSARKPVLGAGLRPVVPAAP